MWTCPHCDRPFAAKRAHVCAPGMPVAYRLEELPDAQRRAAEAVLAHVRKVTGLVVEAVSVGIFVKRERNVLELRPKTKWLELSIVTRHAIASPRISKRYEMTNGHVYWFRLYDARDVDAELRRWITAAVRA